MFFVIIYSAIDQGQMGLSLASYHGTTRMKFGSCEQNLDLFGTSLGALYLLFAFFLFRNPNRDFLPFFWDLIFPKPFLILFSETKFSEIEIETFFQNHFRDFSETKFSEIETDTFFRDQIFSKPKLILFWDQIFRNRNPKKIGKSFETEKFRNRNVNFWYWRWKTTIFH